MADATSIPLCDHLTQSQTRLTCQYHHLVVSLAVISNYCPTIDKVISSTRHLFTTETVKLKKNKKQVKVLLKIDEVTCTKRFT